MNPIPIFNQVKKEFDEETAIIVSAMYCVHLCKKPKKRHFKKIGTFTSELTNLFNERFHGLKKGRLELCIKIWNCIHDWEVSQSLNGLGGSKKETFKELLDK